MRSCAVVFGHPSEIRWKSFDLMGYARLLLGTGVIDRADRRQLWKMNVGWTVSREPQYDGGGSDEPQLPKFRESR